MALNLWRYTFICYTDTAEGSERQDFLSEMEMMKKVSEGHNPHVVAMLGCVTTQEPLCLLTEFVQYGDLLSYLRTNNRMVSCGLHLICRTTIIGEAEENSDKASSVKGQSL